MWGMRKKKAPRVALFKNAGALREPKGGLPYPYDLDRSEVLHNVGRTTRKMQRSRVRLANDPVTASFLRAGMTLLERHLGPGAQNGDRGERPLLNFLSLRNVVAEVGNNPHPFARQGSQSALRDRWPAQEQFVADLINFAVWGENYRPEYREQREANTEKLVNGPDFVRAVHRMAFQHTADGVDKPSVRLALALMTAPDGDEEVKQAISAMYADYLGSWKQLYADVLRQRGLRLRPGLTLDDLANALSTATDGMILRAIGDPGSGVVDYGKQRSLMGTVALAIVHAFLEPEEEASGVSLEQAVAWRFDRRSY
jgi:hypothetical protein